MVKSMVKLEKLLAQKQSNEAYYWEVGRDFATQVTLRVSIQFDRHSKMREASLK